MKKRYALRNFFTIIFMVALAGFILYYYVYLGNYSKKNNEDVKSKTEVEILLEKDFNVNYPVSPRDTVKMYNRMITCLYNEEGIKDDIVEKMGVQIRGLFDEELLENNPVDTHISSLKEEVTMYHTLQKIIVTSTVDDSSVVKTWENEGKEYASLTSTYTVKHKTDYTKVFEKFLLRKDGLNRWKILGWQITDDPEISGE